MFIFSKPTEKLEPTYNNHIVTFPSDMLIMPFLLYGYFIIAGCLAIVAVLIEIWVEKYTYLDLDTK